MFRLKRVAVSPLAVLEDRIACMHVDFLLSRDQLQRLVQVSHKLFRSARLARIVSCCLDTACQRSFLIESDYIVSLPAVHGNRNVFQCLDRFVSINTDFCIDLFC